MITEAYHSEEGLYYRDEEGKIIYPESLGFNNKILQVNESLKDCDEKYEDDQFDYPNNPHTPGAKLDHAKPDLDLVLGDFSRALIEVGKVGTFGAKKYSEHGWLSVPNGVHRYSSALLRHYFKYKSGEIYDSESKLLHLSHLAWNSLATLELYLEENNGNNR
jgi:hypothetical protein